MEHYLPVGNEYLSLPRLNQRTAGVEDVTFLYMALKGMLDVRGSAEEPLIQPFVRPAGLPACSPLPGAPRWERLYDWLPQFIAEGNGLTVTGLYLTPPEERAFALRLAVRNTAALPQQVELGLQGCWASTWHCVNEEKPLDGKAYCFHSGWNNGPVFEYRCGTPLFAFAPMSDLPTEPAFSVSPDGSVTYSLTRCETIPAGQEVTLVFYWGFGYEEVAAATSAKELLRQGFAHELALTKDRLQRCARRLPSEHLTKLYNTNLFFCRYFSTGRTLDTEELVLATSRSPRYYVSAAYWDRDSLLWSFPAILAADPPHAREMLEYVFGRQRRNFGVHSRYIDGTVLEPGFELDELMAPLLALERYVNATGDRTILEEANTRDGVRIILAKLRQHRASSTALYDTFLQPTDDERVYPYLTYDNVLVWKGLLAAAALYPQCAALKAEAQAVKDAIYANCVQTDADGKPYFGWSVDLLGHHDVYDEPPGSLQLLPFLGFCSAEDAVYQNTVAKIRAPEYSYSFAQAPINEIGCPHAPHPWVLSLANSLLCGRTEHGRAILEKLKMDNLIACESVDENTGECTTGEAFATCAGFLCYAMQQAFLKG